MGVGEVGIGGVLGCPKGGLGGSGVMQKRIGIFHKGCMSRIKTRRFAHSAVLFLVPVSYTHLTLPTMAVV